MRKEDSLVYLIFIFSLVWQLSVNSDPVYQNPVCKDGADPWVIKWNNFYYYTHTINGKTFNVVKTPKLEDLEKGEIVYSFIPPNSSHSSNLWAPELHLIGSRWFIYYAAGDGNIPTQRMHVLMGIGDTPESGFEYKCKLNLPEDQYSIDGTVLYVDDDYYFVWSGWPNEKDQTQNIYIAKMLNGYTIETKSRIMISYPTYTWETTSGRINEGPEQLNSPNGTTYIIYSATGSYSDDYCLGKLELINKGEPMNIQSWKKYPKSVFSKTSKVWAPGHCSFVKSPSGKQDWIIYHSAKYKGSGWDREIDIQEFHWDEIGYCPLFGSPIDPHVDFPVPV